MGLFDFFTKRKPIDLARLGTDVHSHLIPGIDDGAPTMNHSLGMVNRFVELGYTKLITTPHVMSDYYQNTPEIIRNGLEELKEEVKRAGLSIELEAAAEYYFDEMLFTKIEEGNILTFGNQCVLFEFSFNQEPIRVDELVFKLLAKGYTPVLAHFERYIYYHSIEPAVALRERGVKIQMNLNSLAGHYGGAVQKQAQRLVESGIVDLAGSDCHRIEHLEILEKNLGKKHFHKLLDLDLMNYKL
mgnify:CR=1 FL=1